MVLGPTTGDPGKEFVRPRSADTTVCVRSLVPPTSGKRSTMGSADPFVALGGTAVVVTVLVERLNKKIRHH